MKLLVTGGCGAIGSEVINHIKRERLDINIVNIDKLTYAGKTEHIEPPYDNYKFIFGDICDAHFISHVLTTEQPDIILHLAAETHVDNSFGNSFIFTQTNVMGTHVLLECVRKHMQQTENVNFRLFVHMSTDEVYGSISDHEQPAHENALFAPSNPYSATKAAAEMICHAYMKSFNIPIMVTRCNNAVSKYQNSEKLIPKTVQSILDGTLIPIHGDGSSKRTFIHAFDIADALLTIIDNGTIGNIYNIGTSYEFDVISVVKTILAYMHPGENLYKHVCFIEDRPFQDYRYCIDATALNELGWNPKWTLECSVKYVVDYLVSTSLGAKH